MTSKLNPTASKRNLHRIQIEKRIKTVLCYLFNINTPSWATHPYIKPPLPPCLCVRYNFKDKEIY